MAPSAVAAEDAGTPEPALANSNSKPVNIPAAAKSSNQTGTAIIAVDTSGRSAPTPLSSVMGSSQARRPNHPSVTDEADAADEADKDWPELATPVARDEQDSDAFDFDPEDGGGGRPGRGYDERKWREKDVGGNGQCLYRVIAFNIYSDPERWPDVRDALLNAAATLTESQRLDFRHNLDAGDVDVTDEAWHDALAARYGDDAKGNTPEGDASILSMLSVAYPGRSALIHSPVLKKPIRVPDHAAPGDKEPIKVWFNGGTTLNLIGHYRALVARTIAVPSKGASGSGPSSSAGVSGAPGSSGAGHGVGGQARSAGDLDEGYIRLLHNFGHDAESEALVRNLHQRQKVLQLQQLLHGMRPGGGGATLLTDAHLDKLDVQSLLDDTVHDFQRGLIQHGAQTVRRYISRIQLMLSNNRAVIQSILADCGALLDKTQCARWCLIGDQTAGKSALLEALMRCPIAFSCHGTATKALVLYRFLPQAVPDSHKASVAQDKLDYPLAMMHTSSWLDPNQPRVTLNADSASEPASSGAGKKKKKKASAAPLTSHVDQTALLRAEVFTVAELHEFMQSFMESRHVVECTGQLLTVNVYCNDPSMSAAELLDTAGFVGNTDMALQAAVLKLNGPFLEAEFAKSGEAAPTFVFCSKFGQDAVNSNVGPVIELFKQHQPSIERVIVALTHSDQMSVATTAQKCSKVRSWDELSDALFAPVCAQLGFAVDASTHLYLTAASGINSDSFASSIQSRGTYAAAKTAWQDVTDSNNAKIVENLDELVELLIPHGFVQDDSARERFLHRHVGCVRLRALYDQQRLAHFLGHLSSYQQVLERLLEQLKRAEAEVQTSLSADASDVYMRLDQLLRAYHAAKTFTWTGVSELPFQPPTFSYLQQATSEPSPSRSDRENCRMRSATTAEDDEKKAMEHGVTMRRPDISLEALEQLPFRNTLPLEAIPPAGTPGEKLARDRHANDIREQTEHMQKLKALLSSPFMRQRRFPGALQATRMLAVIAWATPFMNPQQPLEEEMEVGIGAEDNGIQLAAVFTERLKLELERILIGRLNPWIAHRFASILFASADIAFDLVATSVPEYSALLFERQGESRMPRLLFNDLALLRQRHSFAQPCDMVRQGLDAGTRRLVTKPNCNLGQRLEVASSALRPYSQEQNRKHAFNMRHLPSSVAHARVEAKTKIPVLGTPVQIKASIPIPWTNSSGGGSSAANRPTQPTGSGARSTLPPRQWGQLAKDGLEQALQLLEEDQRQRPRYDPEEQAELFLALIDTALGAGSVPSPLSKIGGQPQVVIEQFRAALLGEVRARQTVHLLHVVLHEIEMWREKMQERSDGFEERSRILHDLLELAVQHATEQLKTERATAAASPPTLTSNAASPNALPSAQASASASASADGSAPAVTRAVSAAAATGTSSSPPVQLLQPAQLDHITHFLDSYRVARDRFPEGRVPIFATADNKQLAESLLRQVYGVSREHAGLQRRHSRLENMRTRVQLCLDHYHAIKKELTYGNLKEQMAAASTFSTP